MQTDSTNRMAGAFAHELSNPVQGIRSMLKLMSRECAPGSAMATKIERVMAGVNRLAGVIDVFQSTYGNFPRRPDNVSAGGFIHLLQTAFQHNGIEISIENKMSDTMRFQAMAPELSFAVAHAWMLVGKVAKTNYVTLFRDGTHVVLELQSESHPERDTDWAGPEAIEFSTGFPVLIDELARMTNGRAQFQFDNAGLRAIRVHFISL